MADFDSSLPVRTQNPGDVISKIADATTPSQQLTVNPDGSINITDNGGSLTVDAVDLDIRDLTHVSDSVKVGDGTDFLAVNADGSINITDNGGSLTVDAVDLDIRNLVFATDKVDVSGSTGVGVTDNGGSLTVDAVDLDIRNLVFATDKVDVSGSAVTAVVTATDLDIRDLTHVSDSVKVGDGVDFLAVNTDGSINVNITDTSPGTPINDYKRAIGIAAGATDNHDYTVTALKTLSLNQIESTGSGKAKMEVQVETGVATGVFTTRFVQFNSTANPNMVVHLDNPIPVAAGVRVRVIMKNNDLLAQDMYSTISGFELP